ncbi:sensor histidine kinase [Microbacterium sp.]|jgi:signal transduction histidine kinase|uniref:sensor histidine kinase n=2 Tax=Microbacterium TaxID=33882 RepID=UPI0037CA3CAA
MTVRDQGPGIDPEERERVFEPFYRSPGTTRSGVAGTGLGLAITRELLAGMGATIRLDDAPDGGTVAELTFPLPPADRVPATSAG